MEREFTRFVEQPTRKNYLAARDAVLRVSPSLVQTADLVKIGRLLDEGNFIEARERLDALPPSAALSPRVHFLAAEAAEALSDLENFELERFLFVVCIRALMATGDGSRRAPYSVCHATDEYDLLESLGMEPTTQSLVASGAATYEMVECASGKRMWFDVTGLMPVRKIRRHVAARKPRATTRAKRVAK